jgi:hypothetical protein
MCRCQHEPSAVKHLIAALMLAHSWYPQECCHDNDCHPIPCEELKIDHRYNSVIWKDTVWFGTHQIRSSQDQQCHICYMSYAGFVPYLPLCVFIPDATS